MKIFGKDYARFLFKLWKILTFIISASLVISLSEYANDPTWDYYDALIMSVLTYLTAPYAIGTIFRFLFMKTGKWGELFIAFLFWIISAGLSYDLYIFFSQGFYPASWLENLIISSCLYILAGLFWNLEYREKDGVKFSFQHKGWFICKSEGDNFIKIFPILFLIGITFLFLISFFIWI